MWGSQAKVAAEAAEAAAKQLETAYQAKLLQMQTEETELAKMRQLQQLRTRAEPVRKAILEGVMPHLTEAMLAVVQVRVNPFAVRHFSIRAPTSIRRILTARKKGGGVRWGESTRERDSV